MREAGEGWCFGQIRDAVLWTGCISSLYYTAYCILMLQYADDIVFIKYNNIQSNILCEVTLEINPGTRSFCFKKVFWRVLEDFGDF